MWGKQCSEPVLQQAYCQVRNSYCYWYSYTLPSFTKRVRSAVCTMHSRLDAANNTPKNLTRFNLEETSAFPNCSQARALALALAHSRFFRCSATRNLCKAPRRSVYTCFSDVHSRSWEYQTGTHLDDLSQSACSSFAMLTTRFSSLVSADYGCCLLYSMYQFATCRFTRNASRALFVYSSVFLSVYHVFTSFCILPVALRDSYTLCCYLHQQSRMSVTASLLYFTYSIWL